MNGSLRANVYVLSIPKRGLCKHYNIHLPEGAVPPKGAQMISILSEDSKNVQLVDRHHWSKAVIWPHGEVILSKSTKRTNMSLSILRNLNKRAIQRGAKGITAYGRRVVCGSATLLENRVGRQNLSFLTLTVPNLTDEKLIECRSKWPAMIHHFLVKLRRALQPKGIKLEYVMVHEIQEKRCRKTGQAYPHSHLVIRGRLSKRHPWGITPTWLSEAWSEVLIENLRLSPNQTSRTGLEQVRYSVSAYLAKYLSKGSSFSMPQDHANLEEPLLPSWYGLSRSLLTRLQEFTKPIIGPQLGQVKSLLSQALYLSDRPFRVISIFDEISGFDWPIAAICRIFDKDLFRTFYDCIYHGKSTIEYKYN